MLNQPYDQTTLMRFQLGILNLAGKLDDQSPAGSKEAAATARGEAQRLKALVDPHTKQ